MQKQEGLLPEGEYEGLYADEKQINYMYSARTVATMIKKPARAIFLKWPQTVL
ncbi:hypothetical protein HK413_10525 [Mucilaginibacter sp. S1162]|uniref:Uncharacterized protein n=1 Tax=Mucilaginibacter humi TaxID=2732510 RepID=A0ABX1W2Q2_9SPHI|nr:hypothetical protein [Mucilaginibacter humi]